MCLGIPMQILETSGTKARATGRGQIREIGIELLADCPAGSWVLVDRDWARARLDPDEARQINLALDALESVLEGNMSVDHLFPDLANRTPQLPDFLRTDNP